MSCFVGIDGGGTRATAVVTDAAGEVLARVEGGAGLVDVLDPAAGAGALADLAARAAGEAGATRIRSLWKRSKATGLPLWRYQVTSMFDFLAISVI